MTTRVPCVVHPNRAVAQSSVNVIVIVMAPTAAPHRFASVVGLYHGVGKQAVEKYIIASKDYTTVITQNV